MITLVEATLFQFLIGSMRRCSLLCILLNRFVFQFLIGSMRRTTASIRPGSLIVSIPYRFNETFEHGSSYVQATLFQFLIGSMRHQEEARAKPEPSPFQFLIGSMRPVFGFYGCSFYSSFNSL